LASDSVTLRSYGSVKGVDSAIRMAVCNSDVGKQLVSRQYFYIASLVFLHLKKDWLCELWFQGEFLSGAVINGDIDGCFEGMVSFSHIHVVSLERVPHCWELIVVEFDVDCSIFYESIHSIPNVKCICWRARSRTTHMHLIKWAYSWRKHGIST
jgi:hypothetical protein